MGKAKTYRAYTGIFYPDSVSYVCEEKLALLDGAFNKWAYVLHDRDVWTEDDERIDSAHCAGSLKKPHFHWVGYRENGVALATVAKALQLSDNDIEIAKHGWKNVCRYLTHLNAPEKAQYDVSEITSNFDIQSLMFDEVSAEDMAKTIFSYLMESGCISTRQLVKWSFDNGCWSELRRSFSLYQSIMQENRQDFVEIKKECN